MRLAPALAFLLLSVVPAMAAPRSVDDCEAIREPLAYNQCLASFGPRVGERRRVEGAGRAAPAASVARRGGVRVTRDGRKTMSFEVVSGRRPRR